MRQLWCRLLLISVLGVALVHTRGADPASSVFRVYFIGNSVTDTVRYGQLATLAEGRGIKMIWGRHMIPGAPLEWIYNHADDGFREEPFGGWRQALNQFAWDAVSIQPFDRQLHGVDQSGHDLGDVALISKLAGLAAQQNSNVQIYIYERWPRVTINGKAVSFDKDDYDPTKPGSGNDLAKVDDFTARWKAKYTGGWDNSNETRDYFEKLLHEVRTNTLFLKNQPLLIPVGQVMADLHRQMKQGKVSGWKSIYQFYKDGIHLNEPGSYTVACTFFATMFKQSPEGLPTQPYGQISPDLARLIQQTVWRVVRTTPDTGINADQP